MTSHFDEVYFAQHLDATSLSKRLNSIHEKLIFRPLSLKTLALFSSLGIKSILEVGSGFGKFAALAGQYFLTYPSDVAALKIHSRLPLFVRCSAEALPYKSSSFDCVIAIDVIEHLGGPTEFLQSALRVLNSNGILYFRTPNPQSLGRCLLKQDWFAFRDPTHINVAAIAKWNGLLTRVGFKVISQTTVGVLFIGAKDAMRYRKPLGGILWLLNLISNIPPSAGWPLGDFGENVVFVARKV